MKIVIGALWLGAAGALAFVGVRFLDDRTPLAYETRAGRQAAEIAVATSVPPVAVAPLALASTTVVTHISTPEPLKGVYMTSWIAGTPHLRERVLRLVRETEVNAVVIDVKDDTGKVAFAVEDPTLRAVGSSEPRMRDIRELIARLHAEGVYVIARIAVFQDPYLARTRPELAVKNGEGNVWRDRKGLSWLDAGSEEVWDYISAIGKEAYSIGFDEINLDYVRFLTDGRISDMHYPFSEGKVKTDVMREFFAFIGEEFHKAGIPISVDIFGQTVVDERDVGIGQLLEDVLPHVDYVSPMVYPSHFADGFIGYPNPAEVPYDVISYSMGRAVERAKKLEQFGREATTTPPTIRVEDCKLCRKLRPWLQDFDLGADYTAEMVRAEIKATYDVGLSSWLLWDPSNYYTRGALE